MYSFFYFIPKIKQIKVVFIIFFNLGASLTLDSSDCFSPRIPSFDKSVDQMIFRRGQFFEANTMKIKRVEYFKYDLLQPFVRIENPFQIVQATPTNTNATLIYFILEVCSLLLANSNVFLSSNQNTNIRLGAKLRYIYNERMFLHISQIRSHGGSRNVIFFFFATWRLLSRCICLAYLFFTKHNQAILITMIPCL